MGQHLCDKHQLILFNFEIPNKSFKEAETGFKFICFGKILFAIYNTCKKQHYTIGIGGEKVNQLFHIFVLFNCVVNKLQVVFTYI